MADNETEYYLEMLDVSPRSVSYILRSIADEQ